MILLILHDLYYGSVSAGCFNCRDSSEAGRSGKGKEIGSSEEASGIGSGGSNVHKNAVELGYMWL